MAAWQSMEDDAYDAQESHGQDVRVSDDYDLWSGALDDVTATAESLMEDTEAQIVAGLRAELRVIDEILDRAAAA